MARLLLGLAVAIEIALHVSCLPLPAGHVVKYRVPSKFFSQPNATGTSDPLYNLLSQIHFGGTLESQTVTLNSVQSEDVSGLDNAMTSGGETTTLESSTNEAPEDPSDVTESQQKPQQSQQMDVVKPNDDSSEGNLQALIEKVVNDEIKKLASASEASEVIKLVSVSSDSEPSGDDSQTTEGDFEATSTPVDLDSVTDLSTNAPAIETTIRAETMSTETVPNEENPIKVSEAVETTSKRLQPDENVIGENNISDSLLSAVSDLLSSILGLESSLLKTKPDGSLPVDESLERMQTVSMSNEIAEVSKETIAATTEGATAEPPTSVEMEASSDAPGIEQGTEKLHETIPTGYDGERGDEGEVAEKEIVPLKVSSTALNAFKDKVVSEIDLKIENLANSQTSLTESTPEQVTETVRDESVNVLEVISEPTSDEGFQPVSFDDSVNQVMSLVKAAEERPSLGDSVLVDKNLKDDAIDLDEVVYGTLKEIEKSLGIRHEEISGDDLIHGVVDLKLEEVPSFENIGEEETDLKEMQAKPGGIELMKELRQSLQNGMSPGDREDLKMNEIPESISKELEMHRPLSLEPVADKRGGLINALLSEITESLARDHPTDTFIPNSAKAALHYKQQDLDEDF